MTTVVDSVLAVSKALGDQRGDSPAMAALRARAARLAVDLSWPDPRRDRPWKYYDPSAIDLARYRPAGGGNPTVDAPAGVGAVPFSAATGELAALRDRYLGTVVRPETNRFTALHYAWLRDGVIVNVPANVEARAPVRIRATLNEPQFAAPHTLIVTGANSRVTVIREYASSAADILAVPAVEIIPGPGSVVAYYCIHRWGPNTRVFAHQYAQLAERDAAVRALHLVLGGAVVKGQLVSHLEGRGSTSELYAVTLGRGNVHADFHTVQDHAGPDTRSNLLFKSALTGESRAVYYGLTRVGLDGRNADANQECRTLLLSPRAKADTDPVLEILTSDVIRVSHGATAGPVDAEQLFYLQARGIPPREAEALLVRGFLEEVLGHVPEEAIRDELRTALEAELEAAL